ncbi:Fc.00g007460.m01.CDS01 [Cosmosporella sp. VM-42]
MKVTTLLSNICAAVLVAADQRTAQIYIQPITSTLDTPQPLAEIAYDPLSLASSSIISYEAPEIPERSSLARIGLYDSKSKSWIAGTTATSADTFSKGYSPNLILTVDEKGEVLSVAVKGVRIDAGQTRDFGPKAVVLVETKGKQPELNKPVVLSPGGKKVAEEPEKSLLQKYWWVIGIVVVMTMVGGGDK